MKKKDLIDFMTWFRNQQLNKYDWNNLNEELADAYLKSKNLTPQREAGTISRNEKSKKICEHNLKAKGAIGNKMVFRCKCGHTVTKQID